MNYQRLVLIGFSGTGKSTLARKLASRLDWTAIDTDRAVEIAAGKTIPDIFAADGEGAFREFERQALLRSLACSDVVIATGGGAVVPEDVWTPDLLRRPGTLTVALDSNPSVILDRLRNQKSTDGQTIERPLLAGHDPLGQITELKQRRQSAYDRASITLVTDGLSLDEVVDEIASLVRSTGEPDIVMTAPGGRSRIFVEPGIVAKLGDMVRDQWQTARTAFVVTDSNVGPHHAASAQASLEAVGLAVKVITVASGEGSKSWTIAGHVIDTMLNHGIKRSDVVVALGGGVVGDLAGFAAAIVLRGVGIVQVPTTLLAMVDSSVGGKTGINHPAGKNLIGAFYQPPVVCVDPALLGTLPARELTQGWAEVVKHAIIQPSTPDRHHSDLETLLHRNHGKLSMRSEPALSYVIRRNIALKASVVVADEREASLRAILNYGHTIGHAIEAAEYRYLHGEAVSVGIRAANRIAVLTGRIDEARESEIAALARKFGLPDTAVFDLATVKTMMRSDKKQTVDGQTWILPARRGGVETVTGISESTIDLALKSVQISD